MESNASKAKRLAYVLKSYSEDALSVQRLAKVLNYVPSGLPKDMIAISEYIEQLEEELENKK